MIGKYAKRIIGLILMLTIMSFYGCRGADITDNNFTETTAANAATTTVSATTDSSDVPGEAEELYVGYARQNITPTVFPVPFASSDAVGTTSDIYATVIAVSDGSTKALLITLDLQTSDDPILSKTLSIAENLGVPKENVMVSTTHNHTAPSYTKTGNANINLFLEAYYLKIETAIKEALADMSVCTVKTGVTTTENYAFVRRYIMQDGSFGGTHVDNPCTVYKDYETKIDDTMQVIRFCREDKKDVLMVNWQAHPSTARSLDPTKISADYVDMFRKRSEEKYDVHFAFFQGASGNIVTSSKIKSDQIFSNYMQLGRGLAERLEDALSNMSDASVGEIKINTKNVDMEVNHTTDHLLAKAKEVKNTTDTAKQKSLCELYGFQSKYEASAIINRAKYGEKETMSLTTIAFGDLAFVSAPFEMFDTTGMYIKENSPYKMTFVLSCTNGSFGYVPSENAFKNGGYEVYTSRFVKGTAEKAAGVLLELLGK